MLPQAKAKAKAKAKARARKRKLRKLKVNKTLMALAEFFAWSLEQCANGVWPAEPYVIDSECDCYLLMCLFDCVLGYV